MLLHYFGEQYEKDNCGNCDNCKQPKQLVEATENLTKAIEVVLAIKENFRDDYVKDILLGHDTDGDDFKRMTLTYLHKRLA